MNHAPEDRHLGEYKLVELLVETPLSRTWLAEQTSVARRVLVDELLSDRAADRDLFLADVRAKAAVEHPLIGSVYEAVATEVGCYYAHELLPGMSLQQRLEKNVKMPPAKLAFVLRRVAEAYLQHEALGQATASLDLATILQDEHGVIRLQNLAIAGQRVPGQSQRDVTYLGQALLPLLDRGKPGTTRMLTLLAWMRGEGLAAPLTWGQTRDTCLQIEHQLADPLSIVSPTKKGLRASRKSSLTYLAPITAVVLIAIIAVAVKIRPPAPAPPPRGNLPAPIAIAAGEHPAPDGLVESLPAFKISAHEITIGQYSEFLKILALLAKDHREKTYDAADQPSDKASHLPDDWPALLAAAQSNGIWHGQTITLDHPVVGIDWWDAAAYADWNKARLPTQQEWFAALTTEEDNPAAIPAGPWLSVTAPTTDRTPTGLVGMAGSVSEWTAKPAPNPANPLGEKFWVAIGGSYLVPGSNALTRDWLPDRHLRRRDLGFRVVFDEK